jgi:hypothetical protein
MRITKHAAFAAAVAISASSFAGALPALGSSHREAPLISQDPCADTTDLYAWVPYANKQNIVLAMNYYPLSGPGAGPNFYRFCDGVVYGVHIDNDGNAKEDVSFLVVFKTKVKNGNTFLYNVKPFASATDGNVEQRYTVYRVDGEFKKDVSQLKKSMIVAEGQVAPAVVGSKSQPDYEKLAQQVIVDKGAKGKFFAGARDDSFFVDLNVFDLLNLGAGFDSLKGANVQSIVMEMPSNTLTKKDSVLGIWTTTHRSTQRVLRKDGSESNGKKLVQVSRLGMPLVNEAVVPLAYKDYFNSSHPKLDADTKAYADVVLKPELAGLFKAVLGLNVPLDNRTDLVTVFLTGVPGLNQPKNVRAAEMLRINTAIAPVAPDAENRLGVFGGDTAGFPNGRRLKDDVTDIAVQAVAGKLVNGYTVPAELGDGVNANDKEFLATFPYLASPNTKTK